MSITAHRVQAFAHTSSLQLQCAWKWGINGAWNWHELVSSLHYNVRASSLITKPQLQCIWCLNTSCIWCAVNDVLWRECERHISPHANLIPPPCSRGLNDFSQLWITFSIFPLLCTYSNLNECIRKFKLTNISVTGHPVRVRLRNRKRHKNLAPNHPSMQW